MSQCMPNFVASEWFVPEPDNWHLKEGAPDGIKEEFEEYMKSKAQDRDIAK